MNRLQIFADPYLTLRSRCMELSGVDPHPLQDHIYQMRSRFEDFVLIPRTGLMGVAQWTMDLDPTRWSKPNAKVWFEVPYGFPASHPQNFFMEPDMALEGKPVGNYVTHGPNFPSIFFRCQVQMWNPNQSSLYTYAMVIRQCLQHVKPKW